MKKGYIKWLGLVSSSLDEIGQDSDGLLIKADVQEDLTEMYQAGVEADVAANVVSDDELEEEDSQETLDELESEETETDTDEEGGDENAETGESSDNDDEGESLDDVGKDEDSEEEEDDDSSESDDTDFSGLEDNDDEEELTDTETMFTDTEADSEETDPDSESSEGEETDTDEEEDEKDQTSVTADGDGESIDSLLGLTDKQADESEDETDSESDESDSGDTLLDEDLEDVEEKDEDDLEDTDSSGSEDEDTILADKAGYGDESDDDDEKDDDEKDDDSGESIDDVGDKEEDDAGSDSDIEGKEAVIEKIGEPGEDSDELIDDDDGGGNEDENDDDSISSEGDEIDDYVSTLNASDEWLSTNLEDYSIVPIGSSNVVFKQDHPIAKYDTEAWQETPLQDQINAFSKKVGEEGLVSALELFNAEAYGYQDWGSLQVQQIQKRVEAEAGEHLDSMKTDIYETVMEALATAQIGMTYDLFEDTGNPLKYEMASELEDHGMLSEDAMKRIEAIFADTADEQHEFVKARVDEMMELSPEDFAARKKVFNDVAGNRSKAAFSGELSK